MVTNPIMSSIQKFAAQSIGLGANDAAAAPTLHRTHFSGPSGSYQHNQPVYWTDYSDGHGHGHSDHGGGGGGGKRRSIALSALTLLAFLFFLNILQNCLEEQMDNANPQIMVMTARIEQEKKEAEHRQSDLKIPSVSDSHIGKRKDTTKSSTNGNKKGDRPQYSSYHYNTSLLNLKKKNGKF